MKTRSHGRSWRVCAGVALALPALAAQADTITLAPVADTSLYAESGDLSNGHGVHLFVGVIASGAQRRALLRFDLAAIPPGSQVTAVTLQMTASRVVGGDIAVGLHRVLGAWGEGTSDAGEPGGGGAMATTGDATWTRRIWPATSWTTPGGDAAPAPSAVTNVGAVGPYQWSGAGLVADVQGWLAQPSGNFGWLLRSNEVGVQNAKRLGTRESVSAADRPRLVVTFDPGQAPPLPVSAIPATGVAARLALALLLLAAGAIGLRRAVRPPR
jgi:hypothetical protein